MKEKQTYHKNERLSEDKMYPFKQIIMSLEYLLQFSYS